MKADAQPLSKIFSSDIRYLVPLYQRPYVWKLESHWRPLWEDIRLTADQLLTDTAGGQTVADQNLRAHFLGAVVLEQQLVQAGMIPARTVIDGQQRLTTLQLFIAAAASVIEDLGDEKSARILQKLTFNDADFVNVREDRYKVWPTNSDRPMFTAVMDEPGWGGDSNFAEAMAFFREAVAEWISESGHSDQDCIKAMTRTIRELLKVVAIDLEPADNAQVIFESLNGRGQPLLAIDLVKNLVFQLASAAHLDLLAVHNLYWSQFDETYWRTLQRQGRLNRARAEIFLMHWLSYRTGQDVPADQLYPRFKRVALESPDVPIEDLLVEFSSDAKLFKSYDTLSDPVERVFFERLGILDTSTVYPLIIHLFKTCNASDLSRSLRALESFLVRRMVCRLTTKNYNRLFLDWLKAMRASADGPLSVLLDSMRKAEGDSARWPSDSDVLSAVKVPAYNSLTQSRIVMLLSAAERALRSEKTEDVPLPPGLTVEHVMPQSWRQNWPLPDGDDLEAAMNREAYVHLLGNLTLVTGQLNPALSNSAWPKKRSAVREHSVLLMNNRLVDEHPESWDEADIDARGAELADTICQVWPGPDHQWSEIAVEASSVDSTPPPAEESLVASSDESAARYDDLVLAHFPGIKTSHLVQRGSSNTLCDMSAPEFIAYSAPVPLDCSRCRYRAFKRGLSFQGEPVHNRYPGIGGLADELVDPRWLIEHADPRYQHLVPEPTAGPGEPDEPGVETGAGDPEEVE
jgi:hypothetical protein